MGRVVAIDGPSGAGKSTLAKQLAGRLGFGYLDTGALYRAIALGLRRKGLGEDAHDDAIRSVLGAMDVAFVSGRVYLDGEDVSEEIRTTEAGHYSSVFSARGPVREFLLPLQRASAEKADIVAEGRDMATVVFPGAWKKFYLDATADARAGRRYDQLRGNGQPITRKQALEDVVERDRRDEGRDLAPLRIAPDAVYIDSSGMTVEDVLGAMLREVEG